jgi:hypothetical protein
VQQVKQYDEMMERVGKTLEIFYNYNIDEQTHSFKSMMKMTVRRAVVTGVGYVKLGFQRAMQMSPEIEARIADMSERLANIERLSADFADQEFHDTDAEAEQLRIDIQSLTQEGALIVREGLASTTRTARRSSRTEVPVPARLPRLGLGGAGIPALSRPNPGGLRRGRGRGRLHRL